MATEEFKTLTTELFDNYLELHKYMKEEAQKDINLSFREYIDFYLRYVEEGTYEDDKEDFDDEDDTDDNDDSEE